MPAIPPVAGTGAVADNSGPLMSAMMVMTNVVTKKAAMMTARDWPYNFSLLTSQMRDVPKRATRGERTRIT